MDSGTTFIMDKPVETLTSGSSGLRYDAESNQYVYTWKTEKSMAGKCFQLNVEIFNTETHTATFEFE